MRGPSVILVLLATLATVAATGCHDPAASEATAIRLERIDGHLHRYAEHEADGSQRVRQTVELARRLEQRHAEKLGRNIGRWQEWWREDLDRWNNHRPEYRQWFEAVLAGDPPAMEAAWGGMAY